MYIQLVVVAAIAVGLSASHWKAYTAGKKTIQTEWNQATQLANDTARETERLNRILKEKAIEERTKKLVETAAASDRARLASDRLRSSSERSVQSARGNHAACLVAATAHAKLFGLCETEYRAMAKNADGHATDVKALTEAWPR